MPPVVVEKVLEEIPVHPEMEVKDEEEKSEVQVAKVTKAAKRKKRKRTLETFFPKLQ